MADGPSKKDIEAIFIRLRSIPANKVCFDCNAKNPTWSSVTYGVFICIDCSAVHRGLGVHVTFVRSTQLDTNWTWLQLRQMQVGGNANAIQFFTQHNCVTTDAQQKYNSRAAQLYREKLQNLAQQAINTSGKELHLHLPTEATVHEQEVDFFAEHESVPFQGFEQTHESLKHEKDIHNVFELSGEPTVNLLPSSESLQARKPTIGGRKVQPKKSGLGAKKGLGATKVKTDFAEIEREVALADENRKKALEDEQQVVTLSTEEQEKQMTSMRLAYQDLSIKQKKEEEKLKQTDPKKAEQMERLGMGFACRSGISHSALTDMQTIEQENLEKTSTPLSKLMSRENDGFFDDYNFSSGFSMNRNSFGSSGSNNKYGGSGSGDLDSLFMYSDANIDWPEPSTPKQKPYQIAPEKEKPVQSIPASDGDTAQKKFGNAKAISSEQFFNNGSDDWERKANLSRFQGSSSISSADYFGDNQRDSKQNVANNFQTPDFDDVKESVRQGVTKVAGKLSSLANGVMSSIQDRYGY